MHNKHANIKRARLRDEQPLSEVWDTMSEAERQEVIRQHLRDSAEGNFTEPTVKEAAQMKRVMTRLQRNANRGVPARCVVVPIETRLLSRADKFARARGLTRAELVARALKNVMSKAS